MFDDGEVVADEQIREAELRLELRKQVENSRLDGDVERRDGFVADENLRFDGECTCDGDPLALAARELTWVAVRGRGLEADRLEQVGDPIVASIRRDDIVNASGSPTMSPTGSCGLRLASGF